MNETIQVKHGTTFQPINLQDWTLIEDYRPTKEGQRRIIADKEGREFYDYKTEVGHELLGVEYSKNSLKVDELVRNKDFFMLVTRREFDKRIVGEIETRQTLFLCAIGALCVENASLSAYNLLITSKSGAGKDHVTKNVLKILPKEKTVIRSRITPTAFTYWHNAKFEPEWSWNGKLCYLHDITNSMLNHEVLKVMCTEGSSATVTINNRAVDVIVNGKPSLFITTASAMPKDEMLRRFPALELDETINQTIAIMQREAVFASKGLTTEYDEIVKQAIASLKKVKVRIPFAEKLLGVFPPMHMIMRTHFSRLLSYIMASTAFHQFQRETDSEGYLLAQPEDYDVARIALEKTTSNPFMIPLTSFDKRIIEATKNEKEFSVPEIVHKITFMSEKSLYVHLSKLADLGFFQSDKKVLEHSPKPVTVYRPVLLSISIPTWEEICGNSTITTDTTFTTTTTNTTITRANEANEAIEVKFVPHVSATLDKFRGLWINGMIAKGEAAPIEKVQMLEPSITDEWLSYAEKNGLVVQMPAGKVKPC